MLPCFIFIGLWAEVWSWFDLRSVLWFNLAGGSAQYCCLLTVPAPSGMRKKIRVKNKVKPMGWVKDSLIGKKWMNEYAKQLMHNAVARHLLADAQTVPKQSCCPCSPHPSWLPRFIVQHEARWCGTPLWLAWAGCPVCPLQLLVPESPCWQGCTRSWNVLVSVKLPLCSN